MTDEWRTGRSVGRTIYDADDNLIGVMDTPELATAVVEACNWVKRFKQYSRAGGGGKR